MQASILIFIQLQLNVESFVWRKPRGCVTSAYAHSWTRRLQLGLFDWEFSRLDDYNRLGRCSRWATDCLNFVDNIHSLNNFSKDNMLSIKPWGLGCGDEELRSISICSSIGLNQYSVSYEVGLITRSNAHIHTAKQRTMLSNPTLECFNLKFSSGKRSP